MNEGIIAEAIKLVVHYQWRRMAIDPPPAKIQPVLVAWLDSPHICRAAQLPSERGQSWFALDPSGHAVELRFPPELWMPCPSIPNR